MSIRRSALAVVWTLCSAGMLAAQDPVPAPEQTVREFVAAFNGRDLEAMLARVDDGIVWLSLDADRIAVETSGRDALRTYMAGYFASCASCRSTLEWVKVAGSRVAAFERASWTGKDGGARSQAALSVYELRGGRIARVHYFPSEP